MIMYGRSFLWLIVQRLEDGVSFDELSKPENLKPKEGQDEPHPPAGQAFFSHSRGQETPPP